LAAVERIRGRRLEQAGRALAQARQDVLAATAARQLLNDRLLVCMPPASAPPSAAITVEQRRGLLRERLGTADVRLGELTDLAEQARGQWLAARSQLRAVEALHERHRVAVRVEQDRREQRTADDLASTRRRPSGAGDGFGGEPR
jgi:hypothetical protein